MKTQSSKKISPLGAILTAMTIIILLSIAACGGPDPEEIERQVDQAVRATVSAMPPPTPNPDEINRLAAQAAKVALAAMPTPAPDRTEVAQLVQRAVQGTRAAMPTWTPDVQIIEKVVVKTVIVEVEKPVPVVETVIVEVEKPVLVTATPTSTPTVTPTPRIIVPTLVPGTTAKWFVRAYNVDEEAEVHVNSELVVVLERARDTGWLDVTNRVTNGQVNMVRFMTRNISEKYTWGFAIKRDDLVVWEDKQGELGLRGANDNDLARTNQMVYDKTIVIQTNGQVTPHPTSRHKWIVGMWDMDDQGTIYLNGEPLAWVSGYGDTGAIDISDWVLDGVENSLRFTAWNGEYKGTWNFGLARGDEVVWEESGSSEQRRRYVFDETLFITGAGQVSVIPERTHWYTRIYDVDDVGRLTVNGQQVLEAKYNERDTGWVEITRQVLAGKNNWLRFSAWNGGGPGSWQFALRRNNSTIWEEYGQDNSEYQMNYDYLIFVDPAGEVAGDSTDARWLVRVYDCDDKGSVYVNDKKIFEEDRQIGDWIDVTDLLLAVQDNTVRFKTWNERGRATWRFAVRRNNNIVWEETGEKQDAAEKRDAYDKTLVITAQGELKK